MNSKQRQFLVDRIKEKTKKKIDELKKGKLDYPSTSNYIFKAILNGTLELQPKEVILEALKKKALNAKEGRNWLSEEHRLTYTKERTVTLNTEDLIKTPDDLGEETKKVIKHNKEIDAEIETLNAQLETLEVRIQLASNSTLQSLINDVDDMGDLSLVDSKLKLLG
jgi:flagellar biosynthesis component FlhA